MLKSVEIRETFRETYLRAETRKRYTADDIRVQISGEDVMIFVDGHVVDVTDEKRVFICAPPQNERR